MLTGLQFQLLFSKMKSFEKLNDGVSFIAFMYKICMYWSSLARWMF